MTRLSPSLTLMPKLSKKYCFSGIANSLLKAESEFSKYEANVLMSFLSFKRI